MKVKGIRDNKPTSSFNHRNQRLPSPREAETDSRPTLANRNLVQTT